MFFTENELNAIAKIGLEMAKSDGRVDEVELLVIKDKLTCFGIIEPSAIIGNAYKMDSLEALVTVSKMEFEKKKYMAAFLGVVMAADGIIDDSEIKMWTLTTSLCNLPSMTIEEAKDIINDIEQKNR